MAQQKDKVTQYLVLGMVALVVVTGIGFSIATKPKPEKIDIPAIASVTTENAIAFNSELTGVPEVGIWQDFQCPGCRAFEETYDKYLAKAIKAKKVKVSYYPLSFLGPESVLLANSAACAADEGKYLPYQSYLYRNQVTENSGHWDVKEVLNAGKAVGISSDTFKTCVNKSSKSTFIKAVSAFGNVSKIDRTPSVTVNGKLIPAADLKKTIEG
jgi:protein-disulfide isomerase